MAVGVGAVVDCDGSVGAEGDYCCGCLRWRSLGGRYRPEAEVGGLEKRTFRNVRIELSAALCESYATTLRAMPPHTARSWH